MVRGYIALPPAVTKSVGVTVDAAIGGDWDILGALIEASGGTDSSGERRALAQRLASGDAELQAKVDRLKAMNK